MNAVKNHLRVQHTKDDVLIADIWIPASREEAEKLTGDKFYTQTWELTYSRFPTLAEDIGRDRTTNGPYGFCAAFGGPLKLPIRPVQSVTIEYLDESGNLQTFGTYAGSPPAISEWSLIRDKEIPRIVLKANQQWPQVAPVEDAVRISVVAGYATPALLPKLYRAGMLLICGHFNENREAVVIDESRVQAIEIPLGIRDFLASPKGA